MIDEKGLEAALNAIVPGGAPVRDYLEMEPGDAEDIGVKLLTPGRWHFISDVRSDERDDAMKTVLRAAITAYLSAKTAEGAVAWPISTDDEVEALARECDWDNRKYMTPADYRIWCDRMRKFARLAAPPPPQVPHE